MYRTNRVFSVALDEICAEALSKHRLELAMALELQPNSVGVSVTDLLYTQPSIFALQVRAMPPRSVVLRICAILKGVSQLAGGTQQSVGGSWDCARRSDRP